MVRQFREPNPPSVKNTICRLFLNCLHDSKSSIISCLLNTIGYHEDPYKGSCCLDLKSINVLIPKCVLPPWVRYYCAHWTVQCDLVIKPSSVRCYI